MGGSPNRRPGTRAGLNSEHVLSTARQLVVAEGVEALTMRRLADRLGVAPNAIYSHFRDKSALLDEVLDSLLSEVEVPRAEREDWVEGLVGLMTASRELLLEHSQLMPHLMSRPMRGRNASRLADATLELLAHGGIEGQAGVDALRALLTFTVGSVVLDAARRLDPDIAAREAQSRAAFTSHPDLPRVTAQASALARPQSDTAFEGGLRWLIDGISRGAYGRANFNA